MSNIVKARIVKMGNSQGIRIPKLLLEQLGLSDQIEMEVAENQLIIRAAPQAEPQAARQGWEAAFREMAQRGDDQLLDADAVNAASWDESEWEWQ